MFYLIFISLNEGTYSSRPENHAKLDPILIKQQEDLRAGHHGGGEHHENSSEQPSEHH
jgi:hypothetical protein